MLFGIKLVLTSLGLAWLIAAVIRAVNSGWNNGVVLFCIGAGLLWASLMIGFVERIDPPYVTFHLMPFRIRVTNADMVASFENVSRFKRIPQGSHWAVLKRFPYVLIFQDVVGGLAMRELKRK